MSVESVSNGSELATQILALERAALTLWGQGDPSGFLRISAPDVTYFDPFLPSRLDGLSALTAYYESLRGSIHIDRFEFIRPHVRIWDAIAVLTFNLVCYSGTQVFQWNCTEVYQHFPPDWRIVQTHWSLIQPLNAPS